MRLVIIESPYAGQVEANVAYGRLCLRDSLARGEAPFASHLFYTQPGLLDDALPAERAQGMAAGFAWGQAASLTVVYHDRGVSPGMREGIHRAELEGRPIEWRRLWPAELQSERAMPSALPDHTPGPEGPTDASHDDRSPSRP